MRRILIYGAGEAGEMVLDEINGRPEENIKVCGFIDDDCSKHHACIHGVQVMGGKESLSAAIRQLSINEVIIAMPSIKGSIIREIVKTCKREKVKLLIVPSTREILEGTVNFNQIKGIDPADLLDREEVRVESKKIREYIEGRNILVTGAAGSIGSGLVHKLLHYNPRELTALDINENGLFYLLQELAERCVDGHVLLHPCVSDIKNIEMLEELCDRRKPDIVFHAAAYKHVPLMESHVRMIFLNNVIGTLNLLKLSQYYDVERFIGISTDKAVYPVSVMGKTKRIGELLIKAYAMRGLAASSVRFGNVLGSNGSVMMVFKRQIERGGPITITSPEMERYFMTIDEAVSLVLQAGYLEGNGDIYVLDMGDPIRIRDLADNLIILSGMTPGVDIEIRYTGVRAGEKLREELFHSGVEKEASSYRGIYIERNGYRDNGLFSALESISGKIYLEDEDEIVSIMDDIIQASSKSLKIMTEKY